MVGQACRKKFREKTYSTTLFYKLQSMSFFVLGKLFKAVPSWFCTPLTHLRNIEWLSLLFWPALVTGKN